MKHALATAGLVLLALLGAGQVLHLLTIAPPQAEVYGGAYVAGYWTGKLLFLALGAWAGWRLLSRGTSAGSGSGSGTFTVDAPPTPKTFTPGHPQADGYPPLVAPDVRAFFLGRR